MVDAARARISEIGGDPNKAAARVLYELVTEEDSHAEHIPDEPDPDDNLFEALVVANFHDHGQDDGEEGHDSEEEEQIFHEAGGENA